MKEFIAQRMGKSSDGSSHEGGLSSSSSLRLRILVKHGITNGGHFVRLYCCFLKKPETQCCYSAIVLVLQ